MMLRNYKTKEDTNLKNKILVIMLAACIMLCEYSTIYASQSFTPSPLRGQEKSNWCWAATAQTLVETKGYWKTQGELATYVFGYEKNDGVTAYQLADAAHWATDYTLQYDVTNAALPFNGSGSVVSSINYGWAVAVGLRAGYGGHMVVITGYDTYDDTVWLQDPQGKTNIFPASGYETWTTYDSLISGDYSQTNFTYLQNYSWSQSVN